MDQIVEYMKFNLKPDMQEMEMQLHPASLGTVHVQIAAKDGAITAQFAAQNETVKAVLETQMIQLKEQFEEQGIKGRSGGTRRFRADRGGDDAGKRQYGRLYRITCGIGRSIYCWDRKNMIQKGVKGWA